MADLAVRLPQVNQSGLVTVIAMFFLVAFGIKSAVYPMFFWLPASYHTAPISVSAIFAGLLTKVGVYAMIRVFTLLFVGDVPFTHELLLIIAGFTMVTGVLGAVSKNEIRRILSFHIISQIGYMIMGLGLFTPLALAGSIFYIMHHIIVKTNLFLIGGIINRVAGSYELKNLGGLYKSHVGLAVLFLIPAFSLAGFPPLSGFWAKFTLIRAALESQQYIIALVALAVGMLTVFSMTKIWAAAFWKDRAEDNAAPVAYLSRFEWRAYYRPVIALALLTICIGILAEPVFQLATQAAEQLSNPQIYIQAVLENSR
jgi:multicomponent Na+:H+ antiporter subunit D